MVAKKYFRVPELIVGFDTETTGLSVNSDRAISYGFCAYRFGQPLWSEHFFVLPNRPISSGAYRVHRLSIEDIEAKRGQSLVLSAEEGVRRAVSILREFHLFGAIFIGANVCRFDLEMLRRSAMSLLGTALDDEYFDISLLRVIDVVEHDVVIEPSRQLRPRRGLAYLCQHYGVSTGGHDALGDARAAVEVFLEQVTSNNQGQSSLSLLTEGNSFISSLTHESGTATGH